MCKRPKLGRSLCEGTERGLVSPSVSRSEWQGGFEGRPDHGGLTGHCEKFGSDSGRGGKLPAGGRL